MMKQAFENELRLLEEGLKNFSKRYPEYGRYLNVDSPYDKDPDVCRLLEGVAFLTASIKNENKETFSDISELMAEQLCPDRLMAQPSLTMVQFTNDNHINEVIEKGSYLSNKQEGNTHPCYFKTCFDVAIKPIKIKNIWPSKSNHLYIQIESLQATTISALENIEFYIDLPLNQALDLYFSIISGMDTVYIKVDDKVFPLSENAIKAPSLNRVLIENEGGLFEPEQVLSDYFCFVEKYLFFSVDLSPIDIKAKEFEIVISSKEEFIPNVLFDKDSLKLFCTPAVNLYSIDAEPIIADGKKTEYPVYTSLDENDERVIHKLLSLVAFDENRKKIEYQNVNQAKLNDKNASYFHLSRNHPYQNKKLYLSGEGSYLKQTIQCQLLVSDGLKARQLIANGTLQLERKELSATNISRATPYYCAYQQGITTKSILAPVFYHSQALLDLKTFKDFLYQQDLSRQNFRYIDAIVDMNVKTLSCIVKGAWRKKIHITLKIDETFFSSHGSLFLFGSVIYQFFLNYMDILTLVEFSICRLHANNELLWQSN